MPTLDDARALHEQGMCVIAAGAGKAPVGSWRRYMHCRPTPRELEQMFHRPTNVFLVTGLVSGVAVLDCDNAEAIRYWRERVGRWMKATASVLTSRGRHYYGAIEKDFQGTSAPGWELRATGMGVVAPPSVHQSGHVYRWARGLEHLQPLPNELRQLSRPRAATSPVRGGGRLGLGEPPPSVYVPALLNEVPADGEDFLCPAPDHGDRNRPNFHLYGDHWFCFGCRLGGRARQLSAIVLGLGERSLDGKRWEVDGADRQTADAHWRKLTTTLPA